MKKIGIIGAGNIGMAIAKGMIRQNIVDPSQLYLSRRRNGLLEKQGKEGFPISDNQTLVDACDTIILAVLPGQAREVLLSLQSKLEGKLLISIVSAVNILSLIHI